MWSFWAVGTVRHARYAKAALDANAASDDERDVVAAAGDDNIGARHAAPPEPMALDDAAGERDLTAAGGSTGLDGASRVTTGGPSGSTALRLGRS